jgi:DNA-binding transcriptional regulator YhcF (GntR family)
VRQLDPDDGRPLHVQVAESIREDIIGGRYKVGDPLPSRSSLVEHFTVAPMTIQNAMRILRDEGTIVSRAGSGVYVRTVPPAPRDLAAEVDELRARLTRIEAALGDQLPEFFASAPGDGTSIAETADDLLAKGFGHDAARDTRS